MCYWGTNYISLNRFKRLILFVQKRGRSPWRCSIREYWAPLHHGQQANTVGLLQRTGGVGKAWQIITGACSPSPEKGTTQTGASFRVPEKLILDFFLVKFHKLLSAHPFLWDNADEAYDCSSELNSKLLGLSKK